MEFTFKERLKNFLDKNNLTAKEFAKRVEVKSNRVKEWLSGVVPRGTTLIAIVTALHISADEFLGLPDE